MTNTIQEAIAACKTVYELEELEFHSPEHTDLITDAIEKMRERNSQAMQTPEQLANNFCRVLNEWLTPEQIAEVNRLNAAETDSNVCHSHDFCDANQALIDAHPEMEVDAGCEKQTAVIDKAWNIAKARGFKVIQ
jgi:ribosomal protein L16 Arg81 hydroxylase